jgi:hypothetical protein
MNLPGEIARISQVSKGSPLKKQRDLPFAMPRTYKAKSEITPKLGQHSQRYIQFVGKIGDIHINIH